MTNLGIEFLFLPIYNISTIKKLIYFNTEALKCQEKMKGFTWMKNPVSDDEGEVLRKMIMETIEQCTDIEILDFVYKLLIYEI